MTLLLKPLNIGSITINEPLTLAPMAGHTNHAFRTICREWGGCGLVCSELISSNAMQNNGTRKQTFKMFDWTDDEKPFAVQLFGNDPVVMAEAARVVEDSGADIIDINMGCWVPKVAKKGGGAALLRDVCTATAVVEAVVNAVDVPVTVKVRSGWSDEEITAIDFARAAEGVGAQAVTVHARTAKQGFSGEANWDIIRQVKETVQAIPVIGNGDVTNADEARAMFAQTGCDAIMIGRASLGRPWVFQQIAHELRIGERLPEPSLPERAAAALHHARLTIATTNLTERHATLELRGQLSTYRLDDGGTRSIRNRLVRAESLVDIEAILTPLLHEEPSPRNLQQQPA